MRHIIMYEEYNDPIGDFSKWFGKTKTGQGISKVGTRFKKWAGVPDDPNILRDDNGRIITPKQEKPKPAPIVFEDIGGFTKIPRHAREREEVQYYKLNDISAYENHPLLKQYNLTEIRLRHNKGEGFYNSDTIRLIFNGEVEGNDNYFYLEFFNFGKDVKHNVSHWFNDGSTGISRSSTSISFYDTVEGPEDIDREINELIKKMEDADKIKKYIISNVKNRNELNDILLSSEGELNDIINTMEEISYNHTDELDIFEVTDENRDRLIGKGWDTQPHTTTQFDKILDVDKIWKMHYITHTYKKFVKFIATVKFENMNFAIKDSSFKMNRKMGKFLSELGEMERRINDIDDRLSVHVKVLEEDEVEISIY